MGICIYLELDRRSASSLMVLLACGVLGCADAMCASTLPVAASNWVGRGSASMAPQVNNQMTIIQNSQRAILNWQSFNIGNGQTVRFDQRTGASSIALNRIFDQNPSLIQGNLIANGQVYLINHNGIVFGNGAQVNVGALVASTLDISDSAFNKGIGAITDGSAAFAGGSIPDGFVRVEAGAQLTALTGGKIMLFAPNVENNGVINTPDGQTILAAGSKVYLAPSLATDTSLRGLLVEVDNGGSAKNLGQILAERGNITMIGMAVNQEGRVSATTSVNANGSIRLLARDTTQAITTSNDGSGNKTVTATHTGTVTLGTNSVTEVTPELADTATSVDEQTFNPSRVDVMGSQIQMLAGSRIVAAGGQVSLTALANPSNPQLLIPGSAANASRIYLDGTSTIDVAGIENVAVPIERNLVQVDLYGDVLKNSPLVNSSVLRGKTVTVDISKGTPLGDYSGYEAKIGRTVAERSAVGGTVTMASEGDIVVRQGATLNLSGGSLRYQDGYLNTTKLVSQGRTYDISVATPDQVYDGVLGTVTRSHDKWGVTESWDAPSVKGQFTPGYLEGKNAGTAQFIAPSLAMLGTVIGNTRAGIYQRQAYSAALASAPYATSRSLLPNGATLIVGDVSQTLPNAPKPPDFRTSAVNIVAQPAALPGDFGVDTALPSGLAGQAELAATLMGRDGVSNLAVYSNGKISVAPDATLTAPGGSVTLVGREVDVAGNIDAQSGTITLASLGTSNQPAGAGNTLTVSGALNASGGWVNDNAAILGSGSATDPLLIKGGTISIKSLGDVLIQSGSSLDVSGGGWLDGSGKLASAADAGSISITSGNGLSALTPNTSSLVLNGTLSGYALGKGGSVSLTTGKVRVGDNAAAGELALSSGFFSQGGFSSYSVNGTDGLTVAAGQTVQAKSTSLQLNPASRTAASARSMAAASQRVQLPDALRKPSRVNLSASGVLFGKLAVEQGATLVVDAGGSVNLTAGRQMTVDGTLSAPAGSIGLTMLGTPGSGDDGNIGFLSDQSIWLGQHAQLLSRGADQTLVNNNGLRQGEILNGGQVTITANKGYVVSEAGSLIDVSGSSGAVDVLTGGAPVASYQRTQVASDAGSINIKTREGALLDGTLRGKAGGVGAQDGRFSLAVDTDNNLVPQPGGTPYPTLDRQIVLAQQGTGLPTGLAAGDVIDTASYNGKGRITANQLMDGGFAQVSLQAQHAVHFDGDVSLHTARSIQLDAPALIADSGKTVNLKSAYIGIGNSNPNYQAAPAAQAGTASLTATADQIDLTGNVSLNGMGQTVLNSSGDIRLNGVWNGNAAQLALLGAFKTAGDLSLQARQIYPSTLSDFTLAITGNPAGTLHILGNGSDTPVLSAGGKLTVSAPNIVQDGVLKAPLGQITLSATDTLTLGAQSLTSASAEGQTIPFGVTSNGTSWLYALSDTTNLSITAPPQKNVALNGTDITIQNGARVDISGGGDLFAYEFIPGPPGRTVDVLAGGSKSYAVVPGLSGGYAPYDTQYYAGTSVQPGDSVYLSGVGDLPANVYSLLPARYALLPGAYLVQAVNGYRDLLPQQKVALADGTQIVAGYRTVADQLNPAARYSGFAVRAGSAVMKEAQYQQSYANTFFAKQALAKGTAVPRLPGDAGQFVLAPLGTLSMQGDLLQASHPTGAHGAIVDIAVPNLYIGDGATAAPNGYVSIDATTLSHLNAESLLLGGTRQSAADGMLVNVDSDRIVIANNAAKPLTAGEVILAANKGITVNAGSTIEASGTAASSQDLIIGRGGNGDGALLRVANGDHVNVKRENVQRAAGTLDVGSNVLLSGKSVTLDATLDTTSKADLQLAGGSLSLGAGRISLGDVSGVSDGLALSGTELAALGSLDGLYLKSYSTLDFYGDVALGTGQAGIQHLALDAGGLRGFGGASKTVTLAAGDVVLHNSGSANADVAAASGGVLNIQGQRGITLAEGDQQVSGFGSTNLTSSNVINGHGTGNLQVAGDLNLKAMRVTADAASAQAWTATGKVQVDPSATAALGTAPIGGSLAITGQRVLNQGNIELAAGMLSLTATGSAADDNVTLAAGSNTSTAGVAKVFGGVTAFAPGGQVKLTSSSGNVEVQNGATVDVSGAAGGGDAGSLQTSAVKGQVVLAGTLKGGAMNGARHGSYTQDAQTLSSFSALNGALEAGQFNALRNIRVRQGDVAVAATDSAHAQQFSLAADAGKLDVSGVIDASGSKAGQIRLAARDDVTLHSGASLQANGGASVGGQVELDTISGTINVNAGAQVGVSGASGNAAVDGGQVLLRAPRTAGNTVGITLGNGVISGAKTTVAEAVQVYDNVSTFDANNNLGTMQSDATDFMVNASAVEAQLGNNAQLRAGIEVRSSGDLTLADGGLDLSAWHSGARPVMLTLRAAGDLNINGSLSDGFSSTASTATLGSGASAGYRLVSGADLSAANPLANQSLNTLASGTGNLNLASGTLIRTGTGNIALAAGRNLVLGDTKSVIYTAGETADAVSGFVAPAASNYAKNGGNLTIAAQGDINGVASKQLINDWLFRQGSLKADGSFNKQPSWWVNYSQFQQGVGALGGGDVAIAAGGNISNLDAVAPTSGRVSGTSASDASATILGGGDLSITAGKDIGSGVYYVARGTGELTAGGGIVSGRVNSDGTPIHTVLALSDGDFKLSANQDVQIETVMNPTVFAQGAAQKITGIGAGAAQKSYYFTYAPDSKVGLMSLSGSVELNNNLTALVKLVPSSALVTDSKNALAIYAPSLSAAALQGNVLVDGAFTLFPAAQSNLQLLAAQNVVLGGQVNLSDADPVLLPGMLNPLTSYSTAVDGKLLNQLKSAKYGAHAATTVHGGDTTPVSIIAQTGDVIAQNETAALFLAKPAQIEAGRDITDLNLYAQNLTASDVTSLRAGRDITYTNARNATGKLVNNARTIEVDGPGLLTLAAGRNIDLGNSVGVVTKGNLNNPALPDQGADIAVTVGVNGAPDYAGFATKYGLSGVTGYSPALSQVFFGQLMQAGKEHNAGKDGKLDSTGQVMGYQRGYDAIATLFPGSDYQGDLNLFFSQIKTFRGGNIDLFVPGGKVNAGLANVPVDLIGSKGSGNDLAAQQTDLASKLGVVTQKGGSVRSYSLGDFLVNSSRVFTLQGGDIVLWSSEGNIDAGKGAKTALAVPPPIIRTNSDGTTSVEYQGAATGSGIRVLLTGDAVPGEVDLIAPKGTVNAGDAGIGSAGNVNIAAQQVIGGQNINFAGTSTGVPVAQTGSLAAGLTGVSGLAADAGKVGADSAAQAARAQQKPQESLKTAYLNVEVIGFGDDDSKDDEKKKKKDK
jgi:filamentous hemagglutinin